MDYNIHKICRICLEEGALTSIYSTEFAMMPSTMLMMCAKIRVYKTDGLPAVICNNCIYRLGVAYHFKQECENSDVRLRQYLGLDRGFGYCDATTNTEPAAVDGAAAAVVPLSEKAHIHSYIDQEDNDNSDQEAEQQVPTRKRRRSRYQRKPPEEHKKRGPKPLPKLPQTCYECNKTFRCAAQLQTHMRTHSGEKPFACTYCPRKFAQKYNLSIHVRTHTKERPFQCEICSKQFAALGNFQAHQKIHAGVRDHLCPICQRAFYTAGDLTKHMATHTGIKSHHCDICGKAFSRQRDMQLHKRKLHALQARTVADGDDDDDDDDEHIDTDHIVVGGGIGVGEGATGSASGGGSVLTDSFKCPDCDKEFASAGSLSVHFRTHGGNNLLNLPLSGQMAPPPPPPPPPAPHHYAHHHHHHHPPPPVPLHTHPHDNLHAGHHLTLNGPMQANPHGSAGMAMAHPHMLPPPPPPPPPPTAGGQSALAMMPRLHPYLN